MNIFYKDIMCALIEPNYIMREDRATLAYQQLKENNINVLLVRDETESVPRAMITVKDLLQAMHEKGENASCWDCRGEDFFLIVRVGDLIDLQDFAKCEICLVQDEAEKSVGIVWKEQVADSILEGLKSIIEKSCETENFFGQSYKPVGPKGLRQGEWQSVLENAQINKKRFWNALKYSPNSIHIANGCGESIYINDIFENIIKKKGVEKSKFIGRRIEDTESVFPAVTPIVLKEGCAITLLQKGLRSGKEFLVTGVPIWDGDKIDMVITDAMDLKKLNSIYSYTQNEKLSIFESREGEAERDPIISVSAHLNGIIETAQKVAGFDTTVLITGESGTGKGLVARFIHEKSPRREGPLIEVNCSAIPESLFESEFFGYETGAFTGARKGGKRGFLELANTGTMVLDEIGDMPLSLQAKLLKVLQDKKLVRVGGEKEVTVDMRILACTNRPLEALIEEGLFRADLYYRLNTFPIHLLPIRERTEEIPALLRYYVEYYNKLYGRHVILSNDIMKELQLRPWHGNVREVKSFAERLVIMRDGYIDGSALLNVCESTKFDKIESVRCEMDTSENAVVVNRILPIKEAFVEVEKQLFRLATKKTTNSSEIARLLNTSQPNAYRKMKKYLEKD